MFAPCDSYRIQTYTGYNRRTCGVRIMWRALRDPELWSCPRSGVSVKQKNHGLTEEHMEIEDISYPVIVPVERRLIPSISMM